MPDSLPKTKATEPAQAQDMSGLPSPPDLTVRDEDPVNNEAKKAEPPVLYPTVFPLSPQAWAQRVQPWVMRPEEPFDKQNRIPQVDLPPENIGYQSPFLPYKGAMLKAPI
jgi:hypothetical protein